MAAPITHLFFADKFCDKYHEIDRFQFFVWNCLSDIRYIDQTVERAMFHVKNMTIHEVLEEKLDFRKGVKFHSFVDENRGIFCRRYVYDQMFDENMVRSLKFLEDDVLYWRLFFWHDFISFLSEYDFPVYDIEWKSLKKWKNVLSDYFSVQPCNDSRGEFLKWIGFTEDICIKIEGGIEELRWKSLHKINDMIVFLESLIE